MKTVYTNKDDIIHLFSNNIDHDIRSSNMSVRSYEDFNYLYSYFTVIAKYDKRKNVYLISTRNYSVTTSKQQYMLDYSIVGKKIYVHDVNDYFYKNIENFKYEILDLLSKHDRARQNKIYHRKHIMNLLQNMKELIKYEKVDLRKYGKYLKINTFEDVTKFYLDQVIKDKKIREKKYRDLKKKRVEDQKIFDQEKNKLKLTLKENENRLIRIEKILPKLFHTNRSKLLMKLKMEGSSILRKYNTHDLFFEHKFKKVDYLKVTKNNTIITSQGVTIKKDLAIKFYKLFKSKNLSVFDKIDIYRVTNIYDDQIKIGCHLINYTELDYIAKKLNIEGK